MAAPRGTSRHHLARVPEPLSGYPVLATSVHNRAAEIVPVAVADVFDARRRQRALARIDLLDRECRAGRINTAAFEAGRDVEKVFEHMSRIGGGGQWLEGDRMDAATSADLMALLGAERGREVNAFLVWLVRHVGARDTRLLWIILGDRLSFAAAAAAFRRPGVRGLRYTRDRFAEALDTLADARAAKGRGARR